MHCYRWAHRCQQCKSGPFDCRALRRCQQHKYRNHADRRWARSRALRLSTVDCRLQNTRRTRDGDEEAPATGRIAVSATDQALQAAIDA